MMHDYAYKMFCNCFEDKLDEAENKMSEITLREYALRHGKSLSNMYNKANAGQLNARKAGSIWLIDENEPDVDCRSTGVDKICPRCGNHFVGSGRAVYCPDCKKELNRQRAAEYRKRQK